MEWLKYIYEKFFMRDLLGKITPGSVELYALVHLAGVNDKVDVTSWPWPVWVLAAAASLITALAFQILAEWVGIHSASPRPRRVLFFPTWGNWKKINQDFRVRLSLITQATAQQWTPNAATQRERYVYLKEGSGNLGTAVLLVIPALALQDALICWALLAAFAIVLLATHFVHAKRQAEHELHSLWRTAVDDNTKRTLKAMAQRLNIQLEE
jgi:hypothetical protein